MELNKSKVLKVLKNVELWSILLAVGTIVFSVYQMNKSYSIQSHLAQRSLPIQFYSLQLATSMDEQKAFLIRYLVDGDSIQKAGYLEMETEIENLVRKLILLSEN